MSESKPTNVRFLVVFVTALMAVLLYLDRFCISFAEIFIKEELGLSDAQIGWVLGSFFLAYALGQVPSGWLTDRLGARLMLTSYILLWSLFTGLTGAAFAFGALLVFRVGFGLAQAGAYPTSASLISKWVPFHQRGLASSCVAIGGRVGGALAPVATGYLIVAFVPITVASTLRLADLLDPPRLAFQILAQEHGESSQVTALQARVGAHLLDLAPQLRGTAEPLARAHLAGQGSLLGERSVAEEESVERLVRQLNQVCENPDLYDARVFREAALEKEAKRLLRQQSVGTLTTDQTLRLNRLLLEGVYPESIRKLYVLGWRNVMFVYGVIGVLVAGVFWFCFYNRPQDHPRCNQAEVDLIESSRHADASRPHGRVGAVPMKWILRSRSLWLSSFSQFATNIGWVLLVTWAPRYFQTAHGVPVETRVWMVFIPPMIGWFGMMSGGRLTDVLVSWLGLRWGRALPMSLSRFLAMGAYLFCLYPWGSPWMVVAAFSVVAFSTDLGTGATWAFKQDVGGRYVGSILGWGNMWGNFGAFLASRYLISLVGQGDNWNAVFLTCATAFFVSGLAALGINATIPIVPESDEPASRTRLDERDSSP